MRDSLLFDIAFVPFRKKRSPKAVYVVIFVLLVDIATNLVPDSLTASTVTGPVCLVLDIFIEGFVDSIDFL